MKWIYKYLQQGYALYQHNGERCFGPPSSWNLPTPERGCEIYVANLPPDYTEEELIPMLMESGRIYQIRHMVNISGMSRGFAYAQYATRKDAVRARARLADRPVGSPWPRRRLVVRMSRENCRLRLDGAPEGLDAEALLPVLGMTTRGVLWVTRPHSPRRHFVVCYGRHREAARARKSLWPTVAEIWGAGATLDWADRWDQMMIPEPDRTVYNYG